VSRRDVRLGRLLSVYPDGVPLDLAVALLPFTVRFRPSIFIHLVLHASAERKYADSAGPEKKASVSLRAHLGLLDSLESAIRSLSFVPRGPDWSDYYGSTNYTAAAFAGKGRLVKEYLDAARPSLVFDLGANTGEFSRIALKAGARTVAFDRDPAAVEKNYLASVRAKERGLLPLLMDLASPSPALGWANAERMSLWKRPRPDMVMALALIHHLAIGCNIPLPALASFFRDLGGGLIIEFVPKRDSQVMRMLSVREDVFAEYDEKGFEAAFGRHFDIVRQEKVPESERILYLMKRR
jgi:ribosomal protein L11 methylase PrmA